MTAKRIWRGSQFSRSLWVRQRLGSPAGDSKIATHTLRANRITFNPHKECSMSDSVTTLKTSLRPIDRDGLLAFAEKGRNNPAARGTNKVHTVMEGQYRSLSYVGKHAAVVVDEPLHLFGQDTAPAPGEIVLSGLGGCIAVGITAVATWKQVKLSKLEIFLEGDIGNPAAWGAGGALEKTPPEMGFQAIRVKVVIEGDATREVLDEIVQHANFYSPVANSLRNPIPFSISLAD
jgi:uncharacterized OsmC-like protein